MNEHDIIKTASLTEKSTLMSEKQNKYVFRVSPKANKIQIKNAIERLFQKTVVNVNTCNYAGKEKRLRGPLGRRPRWKKAIVQGCDVAARSAAAHRSCSACRAGSRNANSVSRAMKWTGP